MKYFLLLALSLTSLSGVSAEVEVKVSGMVCSMCAQGIQKKFKGEQAVRELNVNMDQKVVHIHTYEGKDIDDATITRLITEAGYNVASITRK
jgi:mercuric ion binding protein